MIKIPQRLLANLIEVESGGDPRAISSAGAGGVMQIMPDTARDPGFGLQPISDADRFNPATAIPFGRDYLAAMIRETGDIRAGLAAYNAGIGNIKAGLPYADKVLSVKPSERSMQLAAIHGGEGAATLAGGSGEDRPRRSRFALPIPSSGENTNKAAVTPEQRRARFAFPIEGSQAPADANTASTAPSTQETPQSQSQATGAPSSFVESVGFGAENPGLAINQKVLNAIDAFRLWSKQTFPSRADLWGTAKNEQEAMVDRAQSAPSTGGDWYNQRLKAREDAYQARRGLDAGMDWGRLVGEIGATLPLAAIPGANTIAGSAAIGAAGAMLTPQTKGGYDPMQDLAAAGFGGAVGAATAGLFKLGSMALKETPEAAALRSKGIRTTPGQAMGGLWKSTEDKAQSLPFLGEGIRAARRRSFQDFNAAAYDDVVRPLGISLRDKVGPGALKETKQSLSNAYDDVLDNAAFVPTPEFQARVAQLKADVSTLPSDLQKTFNAKWKKLVEDYLSPAGRTTGHSLKNVVRGLRDEAANWQRGIGYEHEIGNAFKEGAQIFKDTLKQTDPASAARLADVDAAYARYVVLRRAQGAVGTEDGLFSPAQLWSALKSTDRSVDKGVFAMGERQMQPFASAAREVLPNKVPNSGTVDRALTGGLLTGMALGEPTAIATGVGLGGLGTTYAIPAGNAALRAAGTGTGAALERTIPLAALIAGSQAPKLMP